MLMVWTILGTALATTLILKPIILWYAFLLFTVGPGVAIMALLSMLGINIPHNYGGNEGGMGEFLTYGFIFTMLFYAAVGSIISICRFYFWS